MGQCRGAVGPIEDGEHEGHAWLLDDDGMGGIVGDDERADICGLSKTMTGRCRLLGLRQTVLGYVAPDRT